MGIDMPGVKGQKWGEDKKRPKRIKCGISLPEDIYKVVKKKAADMDWSIAKTVVNILRGVLK
jgi:hypothetical protein